MSKDVVTFLKHILECADYIENRTKNISQEEFDKNDLVQDGVIRRLEIIGEAIRHIPEDFRQKYKDVPWIDIMDTRNKLIHDYFGVDLKLVWQMAKTDIPALKIQIEEILESI